MIVFVTTADTEILAMSRATQDLPDGFPAINAVNPTRLPHDLAPEALVSGAALVLVRLLGGRRAWEDFSNIAAYCRRAGIPFLAWSGEQHADAELTAASTAPAAIVGEAFEYLCHGGVDNLRQLLLFLSDTLLMTGYGFEPPTPLPEYGIYHPAFPEHVALEHYLQQRWDTGRPAIGVLFYRAHFVSGNRAFIDVLIEEIERQGCNVLPIFCYSLRMAGGPPPIFQQFILDDQGQPRVDCLVSTLSHSMGAVAVRGGTVAEGWSVEFLEVLNLPIVQAIACTSSYAEWQQDSAGLRPLDTAMTVAMPEFDGRIISVPFSFKEVVTTESTVGGAVTKYVPVADRVQMVVGLAVRLARLRHKPNAAKRVAILLSSYPTKAARLGNAVGLDSPASLLHLLHALRQAGYDLGASPLPPDSDSLMFLLHVDGYLCELKDAQIHDGLHTLGQAPVGEQRINLVLALLRLDNGPVRSLRGALADLAGLDYRAILDTPGSRYTGTLPEWLADPAHSVYTNSDLLDRVEVAARSLLERFDACDWDTAQGEPIVLQRLGTSHPEVSRTLRFACEVIVPRLARTPDEIANILRALQGEYVPAGPSGAPTRGLAHVLPTGRNFYSVDPRALPSPIAYQVGTDLARALLNKYLAEEGTYPESVGIVVWGTSAMRTQGDDIGEVLAL